MTKFKLSMLAGYALLAASLQIASAPALADAVVLPAKDCGLGPTNTCLTFGNFDVYSLPLLQEYQKTGGYPLSGSLTGNLVAKPADALVHVFWTSGQGTAVQGTGTLIDDPYDARTGAGNTGDNLLALMASATYTGQFQVPTDPAGGPVSDNYLRPTTTVLNTSTFTSQPDLNNTGDYSAACLANLNGCLPLWDADVNTLKAIVGEGNGLMFFFASNDTGNSGELVGQDLDAWIRVCLTNTTTGDQECFTLSGNTVNGVSGLTNGFGDAQIAGVTDILPTAGDFWAHVHSDICVADGTDGAPVGQVFPGACGTPVSLLGFPNGVSGKTIDNSLGQNEATFALVSNALNIAFLSGNYNLLTIDARGAFLNNGGDLFWIAAGAPAFCSPTDPSCNTVPEPGSLALAGLGLALLGLMGWRRRRRG